MPTKSDCNLMVKSMDKNLNREDILNRIAFLKNKKGMSSFQLSLQLGHAKTYFYRLQSQKMSMSLDTFLEMLEIIGVTTEKFFYADIENYEKDMEILQAFKSLSKKDVDYVEDLILRLAGK